MVTRRVNGQNTPELTRLAESTKEALELHAA
jgi:hypothetical protein